jgi:hypothetical protein
MTINANFDHFIMPLKTFVRKTALQSGISEMTKMTFRAFREMDFAPFLNGPNSHFENAHCRILICSNEYFRECQLFCEFELSFSFLFHEQPWCYPPLPPPPVPLTRKSRFVGPRFIYIFDTHLVFANGAMRPTSEPTPNATSSNIGTVAASLLRLPLPCNTV